MSIPFAFEIQRSSRSQMFLKLSQTLQESTSVGAAFNKVAYLRDCNFIKRDSNTRVFL